MTQCCYDSLAITFCDSQTLHAQATGLGKLVARPDDVGKNISEMTYFVSSGTVKP